MRTLLVWTGLVMVAGIPIRAADDGGPRLLETRGLMNTTASLRPSAAANANIRVDVNIALVPVTVMDSQGNNVLGLARENFRVFDGTEARPIVSFGESDAPISLGLIFDCSRSMAEKFKIARQAPAQLFQQLNPQDESFLVTVSNQPELRQDFTSRFQDILSTLMFVHPNGTTSLVDGIYMGLHQMKKAHNPRKALIVVSDGGDNSSRYTLRELTELAAEADTQIFSICLFQNPQTDEEVDGPALLQRLANASGGICYLINDARKMESSFARIAVTLHNEYVLGYYPSGDAPAGKYRKIKVQLLVPPGLPRLQVYARSGYYVPDR